MAFLDRYERYIIVGHKEPDGDCVGSQLALASYQKRRGKSVFLVSAGPFTRTEIAAYAGLFSDRIDPSVLEAGSCALVVLDCSSLLRIGSIVDGLPPGLPVAFIDHHASGDASADVCLIDHKAPAVTYLVQGIIETGAGALSPEEAELLLFGLCTDTGFFRHLDHHSAAVFASVSRLVAAGASPKRAFDMMNGGKPFASRKLMGDLLSRAQTWYDGRLIITSMNLDDQARYGLIGRDSDMLYQLLLTVAGMEVAVVVRQEDENHCTIGFRSRESVDVSVIAASFGGGGHRLASGAHLEGLADNLVERVIKAFETVFA